MKCCPTHGRRCLLRRLKGWRPTDCSKRLFELGLIGLKALRGWPDGVRHIVPPPPRRGGEKRLKQYETHFHELYARFYGEKCEAVSEFKSEAAKREWPGYKVLPDGREGPSPESVASSADCSRYCQRFGFSEN